MAENRIIYGAPGVGKSFSIKNIVKDNFKIVTTFHPEYTYFDFVGSYKPISKDYAMDYMFHYYNNTTALIETYPYKLDRKNLSYEFVVGPFLEAYVLAWKEYLAKGKDVYLVIEELNRGNSAAIFGETFQLLDRDKFGASEYYVNVSENISLYLEAELGVFYEAELKIIFAAKKIQLPQNMYSVLFIPDNFSVIATMNTSDQSLFPLDSAFKRRWNWQYLPINYSDAKGRKITIDTINYDWGNFLELVNDLIFKLTQSEDKCLGPYFAKGDVVLKEEFVGKVLFYLWTECFKDETEDILSEYFPKSKRMISGKVVDETITYKDFYDETNGTDYINEFLKTLGVLPI